MDEVVVERATFIAFVSAFADWKRRIDSSSHAHAMLDGCFALALALAEKLGATSSYGFDELLALGRKFID